MASPTGDSCGWPAPPRELRFSAQGAHHSCHRPSGLPPPLSSSSSQRGRGHTGRSALAGGTSIELTPCRTPPGSVGAPAQDAPQALLWVGGSSIELTPCRFPLRACRGSRHRPETTPAATRRDAAPRRACGHL